MCHYQRGGGEFAIGEGRATGASSGPDLPSVSSLTGPEGDSMAAGPRAASMAGIAQLHGTALHHGGHSREASSTQNARIRLYNEGERLMNPAVFLNQRCRSEVTHIIDEEEKGKRLRKLGWGKVENRERLARYIKRNLFTANRPESYQVCGNLEDQRERGEPEDTCKQIDETTGQIMMEPKGGIVSPKLGGDRLDDQDQRTVGNREGDVHNSNLEQLI